MKKKKKKKKSLVGEIFWGKHFGQHALLNQETAAETLLGDTAVSVGIFSLPWDHAH